ncbi:MAG: hypothetical protein J6U22_01135 [Bacteroidaceae bacterium]|nr:hypothetical protein [Bacteroidaceae bacterium]
MDFSKKEQLPVASAAEVTSPETLDMIRSFRYVDDETRAMLVKRPSLIARVFPTIKQRMINEIQNNVLQLNGEMYIESVRVLGEFQIQALKEELNDRLMRGAAVIRTETIRVAQAKLIEVAEELKKNQKYLVTQLDKDFEFCKHISNAFLRRKYEEAIMNLTVEMFDTFDRLSKHFKNFLDLRIGSIQTAN